MRHICVNIMCSVYFYGSSSSRCPECGEEGKLIRKEQDEKLMDVYREINAS